MATNLQLNDALVSDALRLGGHKSKKDAVNQALIEYTQHLKQKKVKDMFGCVEYDSDYDYKTQRRRS